MKIAGHPVELIVYDFDGVMTDNRALQLPDGSEAVFVNRSDGMAIAKMAELGMQQYIMSTETNPIVVRRAEKLRIPVSHAVSDKASALDVLLKDLGITPERTAFVGNDLNDLDAMLRIGVPIAPQDACTEVKEIAVITTVAIGGFGVVREIYDMFEKDES